MYPCLPGQPLFAGSLPKLLRPLVAVAGTTLGTTLAVLVAPVSANAQIQPQPQNEQARRAGNLRPDPLDAQASIPPLLHASAFLQYQRLADAPVGAWRDANDTVTRIGGWRVYARDAALPASPAASMPAGSASAPGAKPAEPAQAVPVPAPMSGAKDPHAGHKMN